MMILGGSLFRSSIKQSWFGEVAGYPVAYLVG